MWCVTHGQLPGNRSSWHGYLCQTQEQALEVALERMGKGLIVLGIKDPAGRVAWDERRIVAIREGSRIIQSSPDGVRIGIWNGLPRGQPSPPLAVVSAEASASFNRRSEVRGRCI